MLISSMAGWLVLVLTGAGNVDLAAALPASNYEPPILMAPLPRVEEPPAPSNQAPKKSSRRSRFLQHDSHSSNAKPAATTEKPSRRSIFGNWFGKKNEPASDWLLLSRCRGMLYRDSELGDSSIYVAADHGVLTLTGNVPSLHLKERAERIARKTQGAKEVRNDIVVTEARAPEQREGVSLLAPTTLPSSPDAREDGKPNTVVPRAPEIPIAGRGRHRETASSEWLATKPSGTMVMLGPAQVIASRPGQPVVTSYLIRRNEPAGAALPPGWTTAAAPAAPSELRVAKAPLVLSTPPASDAVIVGESDRRMIPAPTELALAQPPISPRVIRASGVAPMETPQTPISIQRPALSPTVPEAEPALIVETEKKESPIDAILREAGITPGLRHENNGGDILLFGKVRAPEELDLLASRLSSLPGVQSVRFDHVELCP